jgi:hypothetical protein
MFLTLANKAGEVCSRVDVNTLTTSRLHTHDSPLPFTHHSALHMTASISHNSIRKPIFCVALSALAVIKVYFFGVPLFQKNSASDIAAIYYIGAAVLAFGVCV